MDYAQVTSRLWFGPHPKTIEDIDRLRQDLAVTAILNLQTDEDMASVNLDWQLLETHYRNRAVLLRRVPMKEEQTELRNKLLRCVLALEELLAAGHAVYLHCTAGVARSPTVAVGYLHYSLGWDLEAAVRYVKQIRQCSPYVETLLLAISEDAR